MSDNPTDQQGFGRLWLNRGIAAARAGKRAEAREALFRALNDESQCEMAWLWLAAVSEDAHQERMYLEKVLILNPDNRYARAGIARLTEKAREQSRLLNELADQASPSPSSASDQGLTKPDLAKGSPSPDAKSAHEKGSDIAPNVRPAQAKRAESPGPPLSETRQTESELPSQTVGAASSRQRPRSGLPDQERTQSRSHKPSSGQKAAQQEPTGWTTDWPATAPPRPELRQAQAVSRQAESWDEWRGEPLTPQRAQMGAMPRPKRQHYTRPNTFIKGHGRMASILNEVFNSHEMWAVLASVLSLVLLAFVLAFFFALSLLTP